LACERQQGCFECRTATPVSKIHKKIEKPGEGSLGFDTFCYYDGWKRIVLLLHDRNVNGGCMNIETSGMPASDSHLANKIAKLVEEKGWNQEDFARISNLNRHTVRLILNGGPKRKLRNATVSQCAEAFGLSVHDLRTLPVDRLLLRIRGKAPIDEESLKLLYDQAVLPELIRWLERNPQRATEFTTEEIQELLTMQDAGGPMERLGVEHFVEWIERRRKLLCQVRVVAGSEYLDVLETIVGLFFEKVGRNSRTNSR
jgi:transcriptional regulator with XRE-family HTH domain